MIICIVGRPGAGKSYESVRVILNAASQPRAVATNMPLALEHEGWDETRALIHHLPLRHDDGTPTFGKLEDWTNAAALPRMESDAGREAGTYILADECGDAVHSMIQRKEYDDWLSFLRTHRHHLLDVVLVMQSHHLIPVEVKHLVEEWHELVSLKRAGMSGYTASVYTKWHGQREPISSVPHRFRKEQYALYDTHAYGAAGTSQDEVVSGYRRIPLYLRWPFLLAYAAAIGLAVVIPMAWSRLSGMLDIGMGDGLGVVAAAAEVEAEGSAPATAPAPAPAPARPMPRGWRLPPPEVPIWGVSSGNVTWANGLTVTWRDLERSGVTVMESRMCEVTLRADGEVTTWRCATPGG